MDLLGGYGSDGGNSSESDEDDGGTARAPQPPAAASSAPAAPAAPAAGAPPRPPGGEEAAPEARVPKKRKVDLSRLPVSRPLDFSAAAAAAGPEEAPLRQAAEQDAARHGLGRSLLAALPPPKVTLGSSEAAQLGGGSSGGVRLDLGDLVAPRRAARPTAPIADLLRPNGFIEDIAEDAQAVPERMANHPMFTAGLHQDGPSQEDLALLRKEPKFIKIQAEQLKDPDWYMKNQVAGGPGLHKGKSVPEEVSMYEAKKWKSTTHSDPSKVQKRKHQINWLAHDAMENEAELLDRNASGKLTKAQTSAKYGW